MRDNVLILRVKTLYHQVLHQCITKGFNFDEIAEKGFDDRKLRIKLPEGKSSLNAVIDSVVAEMLQEWDRKAASMAVKSLLPFHPRI